MKPVLQLITLVLAGLVIYEFIHKLLEAPPEVASVEESRTVAEGDFSEPVVPPELPPPVPAPVPEPEPEVAMPILDVRDALDAAPSEELPPLVAEALPAGAIPDEYVFRFFSAADRDAFTRLARQLGVDVLGELSLGNAVRIRARSEEELRRLLRDGPTPLERGRNYYVQPPDDPLQTKITQTEKYVALNDRLLQWLGFDGPDDRRGSGVTVAVIDTAVGRHPALSEGHVLRVDRYGASPEGAMSAHGTAVASLIAGSGDGVDGVAPGARVISLPVMSGGGVGDTFTVAQAILEAVTMGADVINLSLGAQGDSPVLRDAVAHALANNVAVVASTGNDAVDAVYYPAAYPGVLAVGATDANGLHLHFSNRGPAVDLVAPGYGVEAAWEDGQDVLFSGTSASTPIVSGALAALLSQDQSLTPLQAADILIATSSDAGAPGKDDAYGAGVLDLKHAQAYSTKGIYDMVAAAPYIHHEGANGETLRVKVYAQNRGTEVLREVVLTVDVDGRKEITRVRNVVVGQTITQERLLDLRTVALPHTYVITYDVAIAGARDSVPGNNRRQHLIKARGEATP